MEYVWFFIPFYCIVATPQFNLYFTDQLDVDSYDNIGLRYNCFRFAAGLSFASVRRDIVSLCMSEPLSKFSIENNGKNASKGFTFDDLAKRQIKSEDLYRWSVPIDIIEQYQYYLESSDLSLAKEVVYNCTFPRFGPMCQYEFYCYFKNPATLYEFLVHCYNKYHRLPHLNGLTCYTHLKCNRGYAPACLDWSEICDGKVDCLDGNYDEEHCWQMELDPCKENEYKCTIGQCIPREFVIDGTEVFDCVDKSDERAIDVSIPPSVGSDPYFELEDVRCERNFLTSSCDNRRSEVLMESTLAIRDSSISDKCWSAYKCMLGFPRLTDSSINMATVQQICIPKIREECPDTVYVPNLPLFFSYIYTVYKKNDRLFDGGFLIPYLCSNRSFQDDSLELVADMSSNVTKCFVLDLPKILPHVHGPVAIHVYMFTMSYIFQKIRNLDSLVQSSPNQCDLPNVYQCINSSKCVSFDRLMDGGSNCPYNDDEDISENSNPQLFERLIAKKSIYHCEYTNKYISKRRLLDGTCDCSFEDEEFCEDEDIYRNFTLKTISFQTICDAFTELYPIEIDKQKHTDETECEQWECDNLYTHCNENWDCLDGRDEMDCYISPSIFNCPLNMHICVTFNTARFSCLPISKIKDGRIDCLGGTDEPQLIILSEAKVFYCMNDSRASPYAYYLHLCNSRTECPHGDDELFCEKNRTSPTSFPICQDNYLLKGNDIEKFLCEYLKYPPKMRETYFKIDGFNQSWEEETSESEIDYVFTDSMDSFSFFDKPRCHGSFDLRVWLNESANNYRSTCLCSPNFYGNQCQYQNQRLSLAIRLQVSSDLWQIPLTILVLLFDDTIQRKVHSYEQFTYLSVRDCSIKFNMKLYYATRSKDMNRNYSIRMDVYEKSSLQYRGSFLYAIQFVFLPIHRLAYTVTVPSTDQRHVCSDHQCQHGKCMKYLNEKETYCQCDQGWSGQYCHIPYNCSCAAKNSLCAGILNNNRSICLCRENRFGSRCYLRDQICDSFPCENNGSCVPNDDFMTSNKRKYFCLCSKGFSGNRCQIVDSKLAFTFDNDIELSQSVFIHFIRIVPSSRVTLESSPERSTTLQTVSQLTNSIIIYWSQPFHLAFIETLDKTYYLAFLQSKYSLSRKIVQRINASQRCSPISALVNETLARMHVLRRVKLYHLICQQYSSNLLCFHDDIHLCLCYSHRQKRLANCFHFDHHQKFDCFGQSACKHDGQCFQDSPQCPKRFICACRSCYYGSRCQFSTSEFGLSLDAILAYHIVSDVNLLSQTSIVKVSFFLTILFFVSGMINGILSLMTFQNKSVRTIGCGMYLLGSSLTTLLAMTVFALKYFVYLFTQMSLSTNHSFMKMQCSSLDFLLRICLNMEQWLNACVAMERAITVIQGASFNKQKSKQFARGIIIIVFVFVVLTSIHDPMSRGLFEEENEHDNTKRIWCVLDFSAKLQIYNRIVNTFHFFAPFLLNLISSILLITKQSDQQSNLRGKQSHADVLRKQLRDHRRLLVAPVVLIIIALPRLIISFVSKCMNSKRDSWLFLCGYFVSFIPPMMTFLVFVMPSEFYRKEYKKTVAQYRVRIQKRVRRVP